MKRIKTILLTVVIFIFSMVGVSKADNITVTGNQASNATITDINGKDVTSNNDLNEWKQYTISYHITLNSSNYSNGDTFKIYLPSNVQVKNSFTLPVNSSDGNQIATYSMNKGSNCGTVTITNADWLNKHPLNDFMNITFSVYGTKGNSNDGTWKINKVCWFAQDGGVMWNIAVNNVSGKDNKLVITDQPSSHQTLKSDTVQVQYGYYDNNGNFVVQRQGTLPINKTSDGFYVDLGNYPEKNAQITYETIPDKGYQGYLTNKCQLVENGKVVADNSAAIDYNGSANGGGSFNPSNSSSLINSSSSQRSSISSSLSSSSIVIVSSSVNKSSLSSSKLLSSNSSPIKDKSSLQSLGESSKEYSSKVSISKPSLNISKDNSKVVSSSSSKLVYHSSNIKSSSAISSLSSNKTSKSFNNKSFSSKSTSKSSSSLNSNLSSSIKKESSSSNSSAVQKTISSSNYKSSSLSSKNDSKTTLNSSSSSKATKFKNSSSSLNPSSSQYVSNSTTKMNAKHNSLTKYNSSSSTKLPNTGEHNDTLGMFIVLCIMTLLVTIGFIIY